MGPQFWELPMCIAKLCLAGQGDLESIRMAPDNPLVAPLVPIINLHARSPDPPGAYGYKGCTDADSQGKWNGNWFICAMIGAEGAKP